MRLRHAQLPEEARELDKELKALAKEKDNCVRTQDFEKASQLRDKELELRAQINAITQGAKTQEAAEAESGEGGGPTVTDQDIANIVAQWTGIPVEKVTLSKFRTSFVLFAVCLCISLLVVILAPSVRGR